MLWSAENKKKAADHFPSYSGGLRRAEGAVKSFVIRLPRRTSIGNKFLTAEEENKPKTEDNRKRCGP